MLRYPTVIYLVDLDDIRGFMSVIPHLTNILLYCLQNIHFPLHAFFGDDSPHDDVKRRGKSEIPQCIDNLIQASLSTSVTKASTGKSK